MKFTDCVDIVGSSCHKFAGTKVYVSTGAVDTDHIEPNNTEVVNYDSRPSRANLVVSENDILFAKMQATEKTLLINEKLSEHIYSTGFCAIRAKENVITNKCLYYLLTSETFLEQKDKNCSGATQKAITNAGLEKIEVFIPSLEYQKDLVTQIDCICKLINRRKKQLVKLDELKKSQFIKMFGDININDKKWDVKPLGELCDIFRGGSPRPIEQYLGGTVPWIKIGDATDGDNIYLNRTKEHILEFGVKKSRLVKSGSLIFANCGVSLGFARIITFDGCIHDGWLAFENIDCRLNKVFLLQSLNQMTEHFRSIAPAGTQPNLNTTIMKSYLQVIPPIELQKEYIDFVEQIDKSKFSIQQSLEKLETLKKSLMQQYFG